MSRLARGVVSLIGAVGLLAACVATPPAASSEHAAAPLRASILAVRAVPATPTQGLTARLLGSTAAPGPPMSEFIVRTADGRTLSVVQPAAADLTPGSEVLLTPGSRPLLTHRL